MKYLGYTLLPPGQRKNNAHWYARRQQNGTRVEFSLHTSDLSLAKQAIDSFVAPWDEPDIQFLMQDNKLPRWASKLRNAAKERSSKSGVFFSLTREDMTTLVQRAEGRCEVTGLLFSHEKGESLRRPYTPSLDRIVPGNGYIASNCRLVCFAVNVALSDWGIDVFQTISQGLLNYKTWGNLGGKNT